jgi:long-chain acyl-CoA synthetase
MLDFLGFTPRVKNLVMLEDINFKRVPSPRIPARAREHDLASLIYTSGTSGRPKGVMLSHGNLRANIRQIQQRVHFKTCNTMLGVLPQFHSFGLTVLTLVPLAIGPKVVYTARFAPGKIVGLIKEHQADTLVAIPSMYGALLTLKKATAEDFASLRYTVSGGEALPDALARRFKERFGQTINEGYGMTETAPVTNWCTPDIYKPHSVGPALPGVRQRIVDPETGADLPANTDGELRIAGPNVMRGYYNLPEVSEAAFDEQGYLRTGDMARVDDDGHVYITGRIKEMIIVGGENVFPREIEEVLNRHPSVHASGVTRLVDPVRGEVPVGFVETHEDADPETFDEKDIIRHCRESLAGYKVPRRIVRIDELPRNPTGKIMRRELEPLAAALAQPESAATR